LYFRTVVITLKSEFDSGAKKPLNRHRQEKSVITLGNAQEIYSI